MPIFKIIVRCTTVGEFYIDAPSKDEAEEAAESIPPEAYKESVEGNDYEAVPAEVGELTGRIINQPNDADGSPRWYNYGESPDE